MSKTVVELFQELLRTLTKHERSFEYCIFGNISEKSFEFQ